MKLYDSSIKTNFFEVPYLPPTANLRIKFGKKFAPTADAKALGIKAKELIKKCIDKDDIGKNIDSQEDLAALITKGIETGKITADEIIDLNTTEIDNVKTSEDIEKETLATLDLFKSMINIEQIKDNKILDLIKSDVNSDFWLNQDLEAIEKELNSFRLKFSL